jgi:hypothetical protein
MHYCVHKSPHLDSSLSASSESNIILPFTSPSPERFLPFKCWKNFVCISHSRTLLDLITLVILVSLNLFIWNFLQLQVTYSVFSFKYSPWHPVLIHRQSKYTDWSARIHYFSATNLISTSCEYKYCLWKSLIEKNRVGWCGIDSPGSEQEPVAGSCEHGNGTSGIIKYREIIE